MDLCCHGLVFAIIASLKAVYQRRTQNYQYAHGVIITLRLIITSLLLGFLLGNFQGLVRRETKESEMKNTI